MGEYDVIMDGGGPWGIRLQGGKDFGVPLNVARVTPGSKADVKGILAGDQILEINSTETDTLTHMDAQNLIKGAGDRLQMRLRKGQGVSLGEIKQVGSGGFAAEPSKTLYTTDVTHSAGVDHKYNAKPKAFISGGGSMGGTTHVSTPVKKFDPKEYARKKKEELERYKEDQSKPIDSNSEVLKALQNTQINDERRSSGSFSKLEKQLASEEIPPIENNTGFGMAVSNPYQLPIKDIVPPEGANPILDSLKLKMREMNISKERLDRTASAEPGKYLSDVAKEAAARPKTPTSPTATAPKSPSFRGSIKGGGNPTGVEGANLIIDSLKNQIKGDRMNLGLKQTRGFGGGASPTQRKLEPKYKREGPKSPTADNISDEL